ncbi:hypothetical protein CDD83_3710 [Cordyceps sp. RAO-2017]|nr:hypothetical protein CDD83_3710 [Cordyceps sp. RAO-2017]
MLEGHPVLPVLAARLRLPVRLPGRRRVAGRAAAGTRHLLHDRRQPGRPAGHEPGRGQVDVGEWRLYALCFAVSPPWTSISVLAPSAVAGLGHGGVAQLMAVPPWAAAYGYGTHRVYPLFESITGES